MENLETNHTLKGTKGYEDEGPRELILIRKSKGICISQNGENTLNRVRRISC